LNNDLIFTEIYRTSTFQVIWILKTSYKCWTIIWILCWIGMYKTRYKCWPLYGYYVGPTKYCSDIVLDQHLNVIYQVIHTHLVRAYYEIHKPSVQKYLSGIFFFIEVFYIVLSIIPKIFYPRSFGKLLICPYFCPYFSVLRLSFCLFNNLSCPKKPWCL